MQPTKTASATGKAPVGFLPWRAHRLCLPPSGVHAVKTRWCVKRRESPLILSSPRKLALASLHLNVSASASGCGGEGTLRQPYSFENCARNAQQRPLSQGERDRVRGCDLRSWQRPPAFAATPLRTFPFGLFHVRLRWHNPRYLCTCFAFPFLHSPAQRICGGSCQEWNGGGDDSDHSSVVAPAPQGFAPACRLRRYASASTPRKTSTPIPPI